MSDVEQRVDSFGRARPILRPADAQHPAWRTVEAWYRAHGFPIAASDMDEIVRTRRHPIPVLNQLRAYDASKTEDGR